MSVFKIVFIATTVFMSACSSTMLTVKSNPPGAVFTLKKSGLTGTTDKQVVLPSALFSQASTQLSETLVFQKQGYRTIEARKRLVKGSDNIVQVNLQKIDTFLSFSSSQAPVRLRFQGEGLPADWPEEFTTPINLECTTVECRDIGDVYIKAIDDTGYMPVGEYRDLYSEDGYLLKIKTNFTNSFEIPLKPIMTTLQITTSPVGAVVEDISSGGFGYLGETPLIRNFNWEDLLRWSEKRKFDKNAVEGRKKLSQSFIYLDLRITKPGFEEAYLRRLRLPIGEERSFHKNLAESISTITFASDPPGVHVYVQRSKEKEVYNAKTGSFAVIKVDYNKHLGTTPFTLNMDPGDPLMHGEVLLFEKTGYKDGSFRFASGNGHYYEVMRPEKIKER